MGKQTQVNVAPNPGFERLQSVLDPEKRGMAPATLEKFKEELTKEFEEKKLTAAKEQYRKISNSRNSVRSSSASSSRP